MEQPIKKWRMNDGRPIHDGDCHFYGQNLCTCGLLHHLMWLQPDDVGDWYGKERGRHEWALHQLGPPGNEAVGYVACEACAKLRQKEADEIMRRFQQRYARHPLVDATALTAAEAAEKE